MAWSGHNDQPGVRLDCGCRQVQMAEPVNASERVWTSECTIPEHLPKSKQAS